MIQQTDLDVWKTKAYDSRLDGNRVKFRAQDHLTVITDSCPDHFNPPAICVYLKRVMVSKIRFEMHGDLDFPATEEMFKHICLERLKEDKGYGETLCHNVKALSAVEITVAGLIESLAGDLELTTDPRALINSFRQNA